MRLNDLFETRTDEALKNFSHDMVLTVMDMFDIGRDLAIEVVNRVQDYDAEALANTLEAGDRRGFAQLYTDAKAALGEGIAWARSGNKVVKKFRCTGGPRNGRVVSKPAQCFAPPDIKKRMKLKQTKAKMGKKMARKRKKTMRTNAASKRVQALNKSKK